MEEILASIRRIISDGDEGEEATAAAPEDLSEAEITSLSAVPPSPQEPEPDPEPEPEIEVPTLSAVPQGEPVPEPEDDILDLTQMVTEQGEVVDLNEAKSARGLAPAAPDADALAEIAAAMGAEPEAETELTSDELARTLEEVASQLPAEVEEPAAEELEVEEPVAEAPQAEDVVVEDGEIELSLAEVPEAPAIELAEATDEGDGVVLLTGDDALPEPPELEVEAVEPAPVPAPVEDFTAPEEPLELEVELEAFAEPEAPAVDPIAGEEPEPVLAADDTLSEIDQILARAREAAEAQAAQNVELEAAASAEDETAALLEGLEEVTSAQAPAEPVEEDSTEELAARAQAAAEAQAQQAGSLPEDIRAAVEKSLGIAAGDPEPLQTDSNTAAPEQQSDAGTEQVEIDPAAEAAAILAGLDGHVSSTTEEQQVNEKKENYRSVASQDEGAGSSDPSLVSGATAAGAIAALGDLARASRGGSGGGSGAATPVGTNRTLEEMVMDAMAPHLKAWLDANLGPLVEKVVREEIQRLRRRSEDY